MLYKEVCPNFWNQHFIVSIYPSERAGPHVQSFIDHVLIEDTCMDAFWRMFSLHGKSLHLSINVPLRNHLILFLDSWDQSHFRNRFISFKGSYRKGQNCRYLNLLDFLFYHYINFTLCFSNGIGRVGRHEDLKAFPRGAV